jgi:putative ABC transport system substrate-binding protein
VALLGDQGVSEALITANERQARALGLQTLRHRVAGSMPDFGAVFATLRQENADALLILEEPSVVIHSKQIAELAAFHRLPTMFAPLWAEAGGLIAFGTSLGEAMRHMAAYVDKVLTGSVPGELPVQTVTRYELIVNRGTAQEIGVTIPREVLTRVDRVIQ